MFCPSCGAGQPDGATTCGACGSSMTGAASGAGAPSSAMVPAPNQQLASPPQYGLAPMAPSVPLAPDAPGNPLATAGFICGLLGLIPFWVGFALCILAITLSAVGLAKAGTLAGRGRGLAIAGLVLGIVFLGPAACGI